MKKIILRAVILFLFIPAYLDATAQYEWSWAVTQGGEETEYISSITCDGNGNIYAVGAFRDTLDFFGEPIVSAGNNDVFLASFTSDGVLSWVRRGGGMSEDTPLDIHCDGQYLYITGVFYEESSFENEILTSQGGSDMFLLKYNLAGDLQWAVSGGSVTDDKGTSITSDESGNIYITGSIQFTATFGNCTVNHIGFTDIFIAKYDADGICQWAKGAGGQSYDYASSIVLKDNHLFIGGSFNDVAMFDTASVTSVEFNDIYIAHYLSDGSFVEVTSAGGMGNDVLECMALDNDMNVYAAGGFLQDMTIGNNTYNSNGGLDIFLLKFVPGMGFNLSQHFGGEGNDDATEMFCGDNDRFIFTGSFENTINFGSYEMESEGVRNNQLVECTFNLDVEVAVQIGGNGAMTTRGCIGDDQGNYYAAGGFVDEIRFGEFTFNAVGANDIFLAQLAESTGIDDETTIDPEISVFPNPCSGAVRLRYLIHDICYLKSDLYMISGDMIRELERKEVSPGEYEMEIDVSDLAPGVYFIRLQVGLEIATRKLVISGW